MNYFLAKTEPNTYSIDDLKADGWSDWNGVRSAQAVAVIKTMEMGDKVFIYHSGGECAIRGIAEVVVEPKADPKDKKSWTVGIKHVETFRNPITLREIKQTKLFEKFRLVYQSRLSTMPVPEDFVEWVKKEKKLKI